MGQTLNIRAEGYQQKQNILLFCFLYFHQKYLMTRNNFIRESTPTQQFY